MTYEEFVGWVSYFDMRPPEWRADDRAYKLLQVQGVKAKAYEIFPSLRPIYNPPSAKKIDGTVDVNNLKASTLFHKMLSAKNGDKLDIW